MARKSLALQVLVGFGIAFALVVFMLGYLMGSRPAYYGTNLGVRVQQLSIEIRRCYSHLNRTTVNAESTRALLNQVNDYNTKIDACEATKNQLESDLGSCNNQYDADAMKAKEEMSVQPDSELHVDLVNIRSPAGTGNIGELLRQIDENNGVDKRTVIRVLLKDIAEKREETAKVKANCNASIATWEKSQKASAPVDAAVKNENQPQSVAAPVKPAEVSKTAA